MGVGKVDKPTAEAIGTAIADSLNADRVVPAELLRKIEDICGVKGLMAPLWARSSESRVAQGRPALDPSKPLILSRGFGGAVAEEELRDYLPEEKILINKDIFRGILDKLDFSKMDEALERRVLDKLRRDSIGLGPEDVALYYNLIKVSKLAGLKRPAGLDTAAQGGAASRTPEQSAAELIDLAEKAFDLNAKNFTRANGGKTPPERRRIIEVLADGIQRRSVNDAVLGNLLGRKSPKWVGLLVEFMKHCAIQRGDDPVELVCYSGLYTLFNGCDRENLQVLQLASPLYAFITDKIGKVRSVHYASLRFMLGFLAALSAQVMEIAAKYADSAPDQRQKLAKLYGADDRRAMLVANANGIGARALAEFKTEAREVLSSMKSFLSSRKDVVSVDDLFSVDYRS